MKFTKITNKMSSIFRRVFIGSIYVFIILLMLGFAGAFLWADLSNADPNFSLLWFIILPSWGLCINCLLSPFFKDEYYEETSVIYEGRSIFNVVKTPMYYTRMMYCCFTECFLFVLLIVRFAFLFTISITSPIIGIIGSIIGIIIFFIVGMSSYEQSSIRIKKLSKENEE